MKYSTFRHHQRSIQDIRDYIQNKTENPLDVKTVSKRFAVSASHLSRTFKAVTGISLHTFIVNARLDKALKEVLYADDKVADIAFANGFNDYETFSRNFKKKFKVAPDDLRTIVEKVVARAGLPKNVRVEVAPQALRQEPVGNCDVNDARKFEVKRNPTAQSKKQKFIIKEQSCRAEKLFKK